MRRTCLAVQADPARRGKAAGCGGVQGVADCLGEVFEARGEIHIPAEPGPVKALVDQRDLAAQGGDLDGQGGQALAERPRERFSLRTGHRPPRLGAR